MRRIASAEEFQKIIAKAKTGDRFAYSKTTRGITNKVYTVELLSYYPQIERCRVRIIETNKIVTISSHRLLPLEQTKTV